MTIPEYSGRSVHVVSVSGGKDSTATLLLALEHGQRTGEEVRAVWCDTGHEHPKTVEYVDYLRKTLDVEIVRLAADFTDRIAKKRAFVDENWPEPRRSRAMSVLASPTGNPFLDLCLWKGRFPSSRGRFCTGELKVKPIEEYLLSIEAPRVVSWIGVRRDESRARASTPDWEHDFNDGNGGGLLRYYPIAGWTAADVFRKHEECSTEANPLYRQGLSRVGCMPCIMARKSEIHTIAQRWPEEFDRVAEWEKIVAAASKRGSSTLFNVSDDPTFKPEDYDKIDPELHGIWMKAEWAATSRGGRQLDWTTTAEPAQCTSVYGLCE
jgi:3'-phosphoadenosine 5'-phosphosulfate sulfotransferase (PAPS reductase)/FAD synthetase